MKTKGEVVYALNEEYIAQSKIVGSKPTTLVVSPQLYDSFVAILNRSLKANTWPSVLTYRGAELIKKRSYNPSRECYGVHNERRYSSKVTREAKEVEKRDKKGEN